MLMPGPEIQTSPFEVISHRAAASILVRNTVLTHPDFSSGPTDDSIAMALETRGYEQTANTITDIPLDPRFATFDYRAVFGSTFNRGRLQFARDIEPCGDMPHDGMFDGAIALLDPTGEHSTDMYLKFDGDETTSTIQRDPHPSTEPEQPLELPSDMTLAILNELRLQAGQRDTHTVQLGAASAILRSMLKAAPQRKIVDIGMYSWDAPSSKIRAKLVHSWTETIKDSGLVTTSTYGAGLTKVSTSPNGQVTRKGIFYTADGHHTRLRVTMANDDFQDNLKLRRQNESQLADIFHVYSRLDRVSTVLFRAIGHINNPYEVISREPTEY